jgi:hypothetical protein
MEARRMARIDRLTADRDDIQKTLNVNLTGEGLLMEGDPKGSRRSSLVDPGVNVSREAPGAGREAGRGS